MQWQIGAPGTAQLLLTSRARLTLLCVLSEQARRGKSTLKAPKSAKYRKAEFHTKLKRAEPMSFTSIDVTACSSCIMCTLCVQLYS